MIPDPQLQQLLNLLSGASPAATITIIVVLFIVDIIGSSKLRKAAEARTDMALQAVATLTDKVEKNTAAVAALTLEHATERAEQENEILGLTRELGRLSAPGHR